MKVNQIRQNMPLPAEQTRINLCKNKTVMPGILKQLSVKWRIKFITSALFVTSSFHFSLSIAQQWCIFLCLVHTVLSRKLAHWYNKSILYACLISMNLIDYEISFETPNSIGFVVFLIISNWTVNILHNLGMNCNIKPKNCESKLLGHNNFIKEKFK